MKALPWALFFAKVIASQEMAAMLKMLFARHRGDYAATREEISYMRDRWADTADERAKIDAEMAELRAQGK